MTHCYAAALVAALAISVPAAAQAPTPGTCETGRAERDLDVSDVLARVFTTGSLFFGNSSEAAYLVPKLTARSPMYAAGLWVGGRMGGDLRVAGATYQNFEFWPGPLNPGATLPSPDDCSAYDRIWLVSTREVEDYEATGVASPDLTDWPAALGAEVVDGDGIPGNYDLAAGDRPRIYGTQTAFWVMNDVGNAHMNTQNEPIGLEVRVHAFAVVSTDEALSRATVYRYTLINRNSVALEDAYFSIFADPDLGDAADDLVGVDVPRGLGFVYNSDNQDGTGSGTSYGTPPPAAGFDLLSGGLGSFMYFIGGVPFPQVDPTNGEQIYFAQQAQWSDGSPLTVGGSGYNPGSTNVTEFAFPGDPATTQFWSEQCPGTSTSSVCGVPHQPSDRRVVVSSPSFTLASGAARTFDVALLFGLGADNFSSINTLRDASDVVQSAYVSGALFDTAPPLGTLPAPALVAPSDGQHVYNALPVTLAWSAVPGAEGYLVEVWDPAAARHTFVTTATSVEVGGCGPPNHLTACTWRVRADAPSAGAVGVFSSTRTFLTQEFAAGLLDGGQSVVETASPAGPPCPDPDGDPGCDAYADEGNTAFRDPSSARDFYVSSIPRTAAGLLNQSVPGSGFGPVATPDDYEIRFTAGGGYAVYNAFLGAATPKRIVRVPFEIWDVGTIPNDPSDDFRMIPVLRQNVAANPLVTDWANTFPSTEPGIESGTTVGVTEQLAAFSPDRPNAYDLFEAAATAFGGAGATYDPAADGDTQVDINPFNNLACTRQGYYIAFCARNDRLTTGQASGFSASFVQLLFADLAGDGTTPPAGTVVRLKMARYVPVAAEPSVPAAAGLAVEAVRPNPTYGASAIRYTVVTAGAARVVVYDVLGRTVAVVAEGAHAAGRHEAALDAGRLAPGVYVVAVETAGGRAARTFTVVR